MIRGRYGETGDDLTPDWQAIVTSTILPDCRALNLPFICGIDGRRMTTDMWDWAANECAKQRIYFVPSWQAFPLRGTADAVAYDAARAETAAPYAAQLGVHTWLACYTGLGAWPVQTVCDTAGALWPIIAQRRQWGVSLFTRWGKTDAAGQPIDGPQKYPDLMTLMDRLVAAATNPESWPLPPLKPEENPVSNPTDALPYATFLDYMNQIAAALRRPATDAGLGALDAFRLMGEGTPLDAAKQDRSAPTQTPQPVTTYPVAAEALLPMLLGVRTSKGLPAGRNDIATDFFRYYGGDHRSWTLNQIMSELSGQDCTTLFR